MNGTAGKIWRATPKQALFLNSREDEVLYGGAAGGGKSDALLIFSILRRQTIPRSRGLILRRTYPELERSLILRSTELLSGRAVYQTQQRRWKFPNGSLLEFGYCERDEDVHRYQSAEYEDICFDELTQFTEYQYTYLMSRCRTTKPGVRTLIRAATNPGGVGHAWVKARFIDAAPWGEASRDPRTGWTRRFIPARLTDNPHLQEGYERFLEELPEAERRALKDGDWDIFVGQVFREFRRELNGQEWHVIRPRELPRGWKRFRSIDWGYNAPCAVHWHAVSPEMRVFTYRELYVRETLPSEVARQVLALSQGEDIAYTAASPDMWQKRGVARGGLQGESIAETFALNGVPLTPADHDRLQGWQRMHEYLAAAPDGLPWWQIFETCPNLIRTLPGLVYDKHRVEDVSDECEDHAPESCRYALMSRPGVKAGSGLARDRRERAARGTVEEAMERLRREQEVRAELEDWRRS